MQTFFYIFILPSYFESQYFELEINNNGPVIRYESQCPNDCSPTRDPAVDLRHILFNWRTAWDKSDKDIFNFIVDRFNYYLLIGYYTNVIIFY